MVQLGNLYMNSLWVFGGRTLACWTNLTVFDSATMSLQALAGGLCLQPSWFAFNYQVSYMSPMIRAFGHDGSSGSASLYLLGASMQRCPSTSAVH